MKRRGVPPSIDDLLKQKGESGASFKKPRFLSKIERESLKNSADNQQSNRPEHQTTVRLAARPTESDDGQAGDEPLLSGSVKKNEPPKKKRNPKRFKFDWGAEEDTMDNDDYLYQSSSSLSRPQDKLDHSASAPGGGQEARRQRALRLADEAKRKQAQEGVQWAEKGWWEKPLDKMNSRDWRIFKEEFEIKTIGNNIPNPLRYWDEASNIPNKILDIIHDLGYKEPSKVQRAAIPIAMSGRDVMGVAETGSGKTAAFVIPLLSYIMELPIITRANKANGPYAIVLAPTRELAQQIESETLKFCKPIGFNCVSLVGGHSFEEQAAKLDEGAEIIIATPGRLLDCLERRVLVLAQCCYVVMDEADRMITMGFEEQVNKILDALPATNRKPMDEEDVQLGYMMSDESNKKYRQTMMFTATLPPAISRMAEKYLRRHGTVMIGELNSASERIEQQVEFIPADTDQRIRRLIELFSGQTYKPPIIVFMNKQRLCDEVCSALNSNNFSAVTLYGKQKQENRERALKRLKSGDADILVATDVAGRGIDVPDVSLVVNFQMSRDIESYTHRIGRTGRAGKKGTAITFLSDLDDGVFKDLAAMITSSRVSKLPDELRKRVAKGNRDTRIRD